MKTRGLFLSLLIFISYNLFSQNDWQWLNPIPTGNTGIDIQFVSHDTGFILTHNELLYTFDCGKNWKIIKEFNGANAISFNNSTGFIVGDNGFILKSFDKGKTWQTVDFDFKDNLKSVFVISNDIIIISSSTKVYTSFGGGVFWESSYLPVENVVKTFFINTKVGHAACYSGKIYKTIDGGQTWTVKSSVDHFPSEYYDIFFVNMNTGFATRAHSDILKTTDGGESWQEIEGTSDGIYDINFIDENNGFITGDHGVIFKTTNGGDDWEWAGFQDGRYYATTMYSVHMMNKDTIFTAGMRGRILKSVDGGANWMQLSPMHDDIIALSAQSDSTLYALSHAKVLKSINGGKNWEICLSVTDELYKMHFFNKDTGIVTASWQRLFKTYDGGKTWKPIVIENYHPNIESLYFLNDSIGFISGDYNGLDNFVAKTTNGGESWTTVSTYNNSFDDLIFFDENIGFGLKYGDLYQTTDGGIKWEMIYEIYGDLNQMQKLNNSTAFIAGEFNTILKTSNRGKSWQELKTSYDHLLGICFLNQDFGFVSGENGIIYQTSDGGKNWNNLDVPGVINAMCTTQNGYLYAGGSNGFILRTKLSGISTDLKDNASNTQTYVYPNPAGNYLYIYSDEPIDKLEFFDSQGRLLFLKHNSTNIDLSKVHKGLYFLKATNKKGQKVYKVMKE